MNEETKKKLIEYLGKFREIYYDNFDDYSIGVKDGIDYAIDIINKIDERGDNND